MAKRHAASTATPTLETPLPTTQQGQVAAPLPTQTPPPATATAPQPAKKKHGCLGCCLIILGLIILFGIAAVVAGLAYKSGYINTFQIKNSLGVGYGEASIMDMLDGPLTVTITPLDTDESQLFDTRLDLKKYEISAFRALDPGRYTIQFSDESGYSLGACTLAIQSGDTYQFFAVPSGIAVIRDGYDPTTGQELNILTSSLCQL